MRATAARADRRAQWRSARSLRARLTVLLVVVLLIAFAVTGVVTTLLLHRFLLERLDAQLISAGGRFSASLEHGQLAPGGLDGDADNAVPGQAVGTLGVRLVGGTVAQAAVVGSDGRNRTPSLGTGATRTLRDLQPGAAPRSVDLQGIGQYRVHATSGRDGDVQITGLPLGSVQQIVTRLVAVEAGLFAVVVLVCAAVTALSVRRTLRPLQRVAATALHVSELPLTDAGTPLPRVATSHRRATEVGQVADALDHMVDHIRAALASRDATEHRLRRFVADASHELRTPLATIRAFTEYARRDPDPLPEQAGTALVRIDTAARRMATLVDDLLLLARLDAGRPLACEPVDLTRLVLDAVGDARTASLDHRWRLDLPEQPVESLGDPERLHQVLANLLGNARVHTPPGTAIVTTLRDRSEGVQIEVCDDGPGIPAELLPDLFDRFSRGDRSRSAGHGSTGLGLAIASGIAVAHGGELSVDSVPGRTCFQLRIPRLSPAGDPIADVNGPNGPHRAG